MKRLIKTPAPAPALLDRIHRDAVRACRAFRTHEVTYLRRVHVEYNRRLELAGVYVEHAGMAVTQTAAWRAKDKAEELLDLSFLTVSRKTA